MKTAANWLAGTAITGSFFDLLPTLFGAIGAVWALIQIYESRTGQRALEWLKQRIRRTP